MKNVKLSPYKQNPDDKIKLNKLCCVEDWENVEIKRYEKEWQNTRTHRKFWEWDLGIIALERLGKLNKDSKAIGVGAGKELPLYYLANKISHVYATDIYDTTWDDEQTPTDFVENPKKYAPFEYDQNALTALRMDGTKLEFPDNTFDIAFSFSSIEHFGGKNHAGALASLKEIERVLKPGGVAVITTEYILNGQHTS